MPSGSIRLATLVPTFCEVIQKSSRKCCPAAEWSAGQVLTEIAQDLQRQLHDRLAGCNCCLAQWG